MNPETWTGLVDPAGAFDYPTRHPPASGLCGIPQFRRYPPPMLIPPNAEELVAECNKAKRTLKRCACGSAVVMSYDPGCTFLHCIAEKKAVAALPDWQPAELAEEWNRGK